jgi:hypothetical protein
MTIPQGDDQRRAELERVAFGRASSPSEIAAARDALEQLVADDAASAGAGPTWTSGLVSEAEPPAIAADPFDSDEQTGVSSDETPADGRHRRSFAPLVLIAGLVVGAGIGALITHGQDAVSDSGTAGSISTSARPSAASASSARKSLDVPQTAADKTFPLPDYSTTLDILPTSVHRILTSSNGATLWTGRSKTDVCLMWTTPPAGHAADGGISCATPEAFANGGLTISAGHTTWTWDGVTFTTTTGG